MFCRPSGTDAPVMLVILPVRWGDGLGVLADSLLVEGVDFGIPR
jgi:hypothetical protein